MPARLVGVCIGVRKFLRWVLRKLCMLFPMHHRKTATLCIALVFLIAACVPQSRAQAPAATGIRYHFGDDVRWADPNFDDSAWPSAQDGRWPAPSSDSNSMAWIRVRLPVLSSDPLAVRISQQSSFLIADEVFVNGVPVGRQGELPPHGVPLAFARDAVFDLPPDLAERGTNAVVALRAWYPPGVRPQAGATAVFAIDESRNLHLALRADRSAAWTKAGPDLALNSFILLLGIGLLAFWRGAGGRDLLICSWMLIATSLMPLWGASVSLGLIPAPSWAYTLGYVGLQALSMAATVELVWTVHGLRALALKRLYQASWAICNAAFLTLSLAAHPSPIVFWSQVAMLPALTCFDSIQLLVNLWALVARRANRLFAVAMIVIPVTDLLQNFGHLHSVHIGPFDETYFGLSLFLCEFALFAMLGQRAWAGWRARDELRVEFDAAREVQQRLVSPAVDVPGFRIESVYAPATRVGGDFFRVLPGTDGGVLVVVGDVSGKGLKAAMTVSAMIGALRTMPVLPPARILVALNRGLVGQIQDGFVTCCVAQIGRDGTVTLANAGHLSPYKAGVEMSVAAGLPLGIDPHAEYEERQFTLDLDESLTFVSDGVVEARNSTGELFSFDRTQAMSGAGAQALAQAAIDFGQDDDITVLSVTRRTEDWGAEAPLCPPAPVPA